MKEQMGDLYSDYLDKLLYCNKQLSIKDEPIEVPHMPDYYVIPGFSRYYIRRDGWIYDRIAIREFYYNESGSNYPYYSLQKDGSKMQRTYDAHRILALSFIPIPDVGVDMEVNHKDKDRRNCAIDNLEWVTRSENVSHGKKYLSNKGIYVERKHLYKLKRCNRELFETENLDHIVEFMGVSKSKLINELSKHKYGEWVIFGDESVMVIALDELSEDDRIVYIFDMVEDSVNKVPSITSASLITGIIRSSVTDMIGEQENSYGKIIKGYRFYKNRDLIDDDFKLTDGEKLYHRYCRSNTVPHNSCGYLVYSVTKNTLYPYHSLRDMAGKFKSTKMTYPALGEMSRCAMGNGLFEIIPIYKGRDNSILTDYYRSFMSKFDGVFEINIPNYFDQ